MLAHLQLASEMDVDLDDIDRVIWFYDFLLQLSTDSPTPTHTDPNLSINAIGTVFGEHLIRRTGMKWVVASDEFGTELAVHGPANDALIYPANAVAKRWAANKNGDFMRDITKGAVRIADAGRQ